MAFSALTQYLPGDEEGKQRWLLEHYLEHQEMYRALLAQNYASVNLPIQHMEEPKAWLAAHQLVSQSQWTGIGGGQSVNLEDVNWDKSDELLDWFNIHTSWHYQARQALGL